MKPFPANKNERSEFSLLPEDTTQALKLLITLSEKLITVAERETQVLIQNDMTSFAIIQDEKETLSLRYSRASEEFRARLEEFRNADNVLLNSLENLQRRLGDITKSNRDMVQRLFESSKKKTHESLITVQELAQQKSVQETELNKHINGHINGHSEGA